MARVARNFGMPFTGFNAAVKRWQAALSELTDASYDWLIDPDEGKLVCRGGSLLLGQYIKDSNEFLSQFESGPTYGDLYARQVIDFSSDAITDGLPTHLILYSNDTVAGTLIWGSPNTFTITNCSMASGSNIMTHADADAFEDLTLGCRVVIAGISGVAQVIEIDPDGGGNFNSVRLSIEADSAITNQTATIGGPIHGINTFIGKGFGGTGGLRVIAVAGVTNFLRLNTERALVAVGSRRIVQVGDYHILGNGYTGHVPMKFNGDWNDQLDTGSRTQKYLPAGNIPPMFMNVADGSTAILGSTPQFKANTWAFFSMMYKYRDGSFSQPFIPKDIVVPAGSVPFHGRFDCRTDCDDLTITLPVGPDEVDERWILRTIFGTDSAPPALLDPNGNSLLGVAAIIRNNTQTTYTLTQGRDSSIYYDPIAVRFDRYWMPPTKFLWAGDQRIWGGGLKPVCHAILICNIGDNSGESGPIDPLVVTCNGTTLGLLAYDTSYAGASYVPVSITLTGKTIDQVITEINTAIGSGAIPVGADWGRHYRAQLAPGADPGASATLLKDISAIQFEASAPLGSMRINSAGRPGLLVFGSSYTAVQPVQRRRIWFSEGSPGAPPHSMNVPPRNFRQGPSRWGVFVGGAPLTHGQIVCFSKAIAICHNTRDGRTGLDDDYRLDPLNENRGCISDASIVHGDGWVGYMTSEGYVVTDGANEVLISKKLYNPGTRRGILRDPITSCIAAFATNDGEASARYIQAWLDGTKLYLSLGVAATSPSVADDPLFVYDFSGGVAGSGLGEVLRPDRSAWGWSAAHSNSPKFPGVRSALAGGVVRRGGDSTPRRLVVASSYLSSSHASTPHGVIARIDETTVRYDFTQLDLDGTTHTATAANGNATLTAVSGDLSRIPVGAICIEVTPTRIRVGSVVQSVNQTAATVTLDRTAKSDGSVTIFFLGRDIEPAGYLATDLAGTVKMKALQGMWPIYNQVGSGMEVRVTNELDRTGFVTHPLAAAPSADGFTRQKLNLAQSLKGLGKGYEAVVIDRGETTLQSEFWGLEAEVDVLDSHR